ALGRKQSLEKTNQADLLQCPDDPAGEKRERHGKSQIQVGIRVTKQGIVDYETVCGLMPPADRAGPRYQAEPICRQNENENGRKEQEGSFDQMWPDDSLQKAVQTSYKPFQEVLSSVRNCLHAPRGDPGKDDQAQSHDPSDDHGIGYGQTERSRDIDGLL